MSIRDNISRMKARDRLIAKKLESSDIPKEMKGRPLRLPQMNFPVPLEKLIQAMYGPPRYALRARQIEDKTDRLMEAVATEYTNMVNTVGKHPKRFAQKWKEFICSLQLYELNDLIERHNMYYPIEANLAIDPKSEGFLIGSIPWEPKEKITTEALLKEFPPYITAALNQDENE